MTAELDPIRFKSGLGDVLARYITTAAPVSAARAPRLSNAIDAACAEAGLVKGPFVESLPDFEKGGSIKQLVEEGILHETWIKLASSDEGRRLFERPLHVHQTAAIGRDENYLVATGTGSGKTESFLFPLVDDLVRQGNLAEIISLSVRRVVIEGLQFSCGTFFRRSGATAVGLGAAGHWATRSSPTARPSPQRFDHCSAGKSLSSLLRGLAQCRKRSCFASLRTIALSYRDTLRREPVPGLS